MKEFEYDGLKIFWTGHAGFKVEGDIRIYFDPYKLRKYSPADVVFVSHGHFDHFSSSDIKSIVTDETTLICASELINELINYPGEKVFIKPGNEYRNDLLKLNVLAVEAYNINKFRAPGVPFHPKEDKKVGFVVDYYGVRMYHAGDTDNIPEMAKLKDLNIDIAFLPVSGTYVMTVDEAVQAAKNIRPKVAIPMHWGAIVGDKRDAEKFRDLLKDSGIDVAILDKE